MTNDEFFAALIAADNLDAAIQAVGAFVAADDNAQWVPVGARENNRGTIEVSADPGRSLVERLTNAIDAVLEAEHDSHSGVPECRSPKEAAVAWLAIPASGLSELTPAARRGLAQRVSIHVMPGSGRDARTIEVRDRGVGLRPDQMPHTILSLNESNKMQKHYLAGAYGQGGSSTFASAKCTLIASRRVGSDSIGFTVVRYEDLPPEDYKIGRYVYLVVAGGVLPAITADERFAAGTVVKHFGYDLSDYKSPLGPNSVYGLLNQVLFDPILPVWLDDRVHNYRRVIKGARNALNGAVDEGDEGGGRTRLSHHVPLFFADLGADLGLLGIEYWVLERPTTSNKRPSAAFVNPSKPIVLTINGQNQAEFSQMLIRKFAELPYLRERLICHVDCNRLTASAKRALFVSNREDARRGFVYEAIQNEVLRVLRSDDELTRLNTLARDETLEQRDETAIQQVRREVAKLLRLQGLNVGQGEGVRSGTDQSGTERPTPRPRPRPTPRPIDLKEPPTFIRFVWPTDTDLTLHPGQRRYLRIETDANSEYHDAADPLRSRINMIILCAGVTSKGSTPLKGGRMRVVADAAADARIGDTGVVRVELTRVGLPTLSDERPLRIVERPQAKKDKTTLTLPPFDTVAVNGPDDPKWTQLSWPDSIETVASSAEVESGILTIYYSTAFPKFAAQRELLERRDVALADSFTKRYEIWIAVHSLMLHKIEEEQPTETASYDDDTETTEALERAERCRAAALAALFAAREVEASLAAAKAAD